MPDPNAMQMSPRSTRMVALVVLYRMDAEQSPAWRSLRDMLARDNTIDEAVEPMLWDNTPGPRSAPTGFRGTFQHDPNNTGLAAAYNAALHHAEAVNAPWLLVLDQDTGVTQAYVTALLHATTHTDAVAVVPHLVHAGHTVSPFLPSLSGPVRSIENGFEGIVPAPVQAFNSGACFRVRTLRAVGGFDTDFPLDYLDHATFAALAQHGGRVLVLRDELQHALSSDHCRVMNAGERARLRSILAAEGRFYRRFGTAEELRSTSRRLLRRAMSVLVHKQDVRQAAMILRQMVKPAP